METLPMLKEVTRLDRAVAILNASEKDDLIVDRWNTITAQIDELPLTGASDEMRQAIECFGVTCYKILERYCESGADQPDQWDKVDTTKLVELSRQLAEYIRDAESERILARLRRHDGVLPEAEIIEARHHRDWFVSRLLDEFQSAIDQTIQGNDQWNTVPFFSIFLFSEWNIVASVPIVLNALELPNERLFDLFGDAIHEQLPRYVAQFLANDLDRIDELIRKPSNNVYVRWSSANGYKYLVRDGVVSLDDAVRRLDQLFDEVKISDDNGRPGLGHPYELCSGIIEVILSIGGASRSKIPDRDKNWDFVDESIIGRTEFEVSSINDASSEMTDELRQLPPTQLEDCLAEFRHWAIFHQEAKPSPNPPVPQPRTRPEPKSVHRSNPTVPAPEVVATQASERIPRNAKCPCGSGKKYKQCCLHNSSRTRANNL